MDDVGGGWPNPEMTRRSFLKASAAAGGAAALVLGPGQPILRALEANEAAAAGASQEEIVVQSVCRPNCHSMCRHNVHVRDGHVVKTSRGALPDPRYERICLRGLTHVQRIYDPDRIKYPMKRAGERGENKWERISWDEAITTITGKWKEIQQKYGNQAIAFHHMGGDVSLLNCWPTITRFTNLLQGTYVDYNTDMGIDWGTARVLGHSDANGPSANDPSDWVNGKVHFVWGYNMTESNIHAWHFMADALEAGAKLIVIDPVYTHTAAKADKFVPIKPGSDPALVLAMINVILSENLYDKQFVLGHTCAPFLVREDNGLFLRMSDLGVEATQGPINPMTGQPIVIDPAVAWDSKKGAAAAADTIKSPALQGAYTVKGIKVRTAFDLLNEEIAQYTPKMAAKTTGVPADTIVELARLQAGDAVFNHHAFGNGCYTNAAMFGHALATLAGLTGNVGKSGAGVGFCVHVGQCFNWAWLLMQNNPNPPVPTLVFPEVVKSGEFMGKPHPIKALHVSNSNLFSNSLNTKALIEDMLPNLDFLVVHDMVFNDTARYADILLPVPHWYEQEEVVALFFAQHPYMQHSAKAVEPLFEAKPDSEILRLMLKGMGISDPEFAKTDNEIVDALLATPEAQAAGLSYANLKQKGAIEVPGLEIVFEGGRFGTPSGRLEFYVEQPVVRLQYGQAFDPESQRLPRWVPPAEAWPENPLYEKYPFVVITSHERFRIHTQWADVPWLRELDPEPTVRIHPDDAGARSIANGDYVEVFNDRSSYVAKAVLSQGVSPGVLNVPKGWQKYQFKAGGYQQITGPNFNPVEVNSSFFETLADVRAWNGQVS